MAVQVVTITIRVSLRRIDKLRKASILHLSAWLWPITRAKASSLALTRSLLCVAASKFTIKRTRFSCDHELNHASGFGKPFNVAHRQYAG